MSLAPVFVSLTVTITVSPGFQSGPAWGSERTRGSIALQSSDGASPAPPTPALEELALAVEEPPPPPFPTLLVEALVDVGPAPPLPSVEEEPVTTSPPQARDQRGATITIAETRKWRRMGPRR